MQLRTVHKIDEEAMSNSYSHALFFIFYSFISFHKIEKKRKADEGTAEELWKIFYTGTGYTYLIPNFPYYYSELSYSQQSDWRKY